VEQTVIRAPFDGVVLTKNANVGDNITPFSNAADTKGAVVTMADMATLEVEADVAESSLSRIRVGQACEIQLDAYPDLRLRGEVSRLVPTVDRTKASVLTKVRFVDPADRREVRVLPEMSAKIAFLSRPMADAERTPRTVVHRDALVARGGARGVFLVADGSARFTSVTPGGEIGDLVEIGSGLKPGDKIVLAPPPGLDDGARVTAAAR
jgi:RND family efflux transporter MFP subunit